MSIHKQTLTKEQDHHLHSVAFNAERKTTTVRVDVEALRNLLIDHGRLLSQEEYVDAEGNDGPSTGKIISS